MSKNWIYGVICGLCALVLVSLAIAYSWPEPAPPPAEQLTTEIVESNDKAMRLAAIRKLGNQGRAARPEVARAFASVKTKIDGGEEPDEQVVITMVQAVAATDDWQSLPSLFDLMEHPNARIRGKAGAAAQKLLGADYFWRANMPRRERQKLIDQMREEFGFMQPALEESYGKR